jgi:hypothetical protein
MPGFLNKFPEIESMTGSGQSVCLTKYGYDATVVLSFEECSESACDIESKLDEADRAAAISDIRYTHEEVFSRLKGGLDG